MAVLFYDLLRTTRRGRVALLRTVYALVLLVMLGLLYFRWFPDRLTFVGAFAPSTPVLPSQMARFGEQLATTFLLVQLAAAILLTPVVCAGAIAEERQRGTLDALLTTHLTGGQIILGKLLSRVAQLFGVLATGLPVVALIPLWGGVDPTLILAGFGVCGVAILSLAALTLCFSVQATSVRAAAASTYFLGAVLIVGTYYVPVIRAGNPIRVMNEMFRPRSADQAARLRLLGMCAAAHAPLIVAMTWAAARSVRWQRQRGHRRTTPPPTPIRRWPPPASSGWRPTLRPGHRPILWKELNFGGGAGFHSAARLLSVSILVCGVIFTFGSVAVVAHTGSYEAETNVERVVRVSILVFVTTCVIDAALNAAATVTRERERRTLDGLLMLPELTTAVLRAKWLATIWPLHRIGLAAAFVLVLGALAIRVQPAVVVWLPIAAAVHVGFVASAGVFLSVVARSTGVATTGIVLIVIFSCVAPRLLADFGAGLVVADPAMRPPILVGFIEGGLAPPMTWWRLLEVAVGADNDSHPHSAEHRFMGLLAGLACYAASAGLFWAAACRRFRREYDRGIPT